MDVELFEYLATDSLHDKVVETIDISRISDADATDCCTCRSWDSTSNSTKRIRLTFHDAEIRRHLHAWFDIYDTSIQMIGERIQVALTECSPGLQTFILCSKADVCECSS